MPPIGNPRPRYLATEREIRLLLAWCAHHRVQQNGDTAIRSAIASQRGPRGGFREEGSLLGAHTHHQEKVPASCRIIILSSPSDARRTPDSDFALTLHPQVSLQYGRIYHGGTRNRGHPVSCIVPICVLILVALRTQKCCPPKYSCACKHTALLRLLLLPCAHTTPLLHTRRLSCQSHAT